MPSTYGLLNAYRAGAKEVKPDVVFKAAYIGSFFDPPKAKEAAIAMIEQGVDVIYAERLGVIEACAEKGGYAIGNMTDQSAINPKVVVTSVIWDPYPVIKAAAEQVKGGTYKAQDFSTLENIANGGNYLSAFGAFDGQISGRCQGRPQEAPRGDRRRHLQGALRRERDEVRLIACVKPAERKRHRGRS